MRNKKIYPIQNENNIYKNKNRTHKSRHRSRPIANWNKSNLTRIFPTNVPQLLYRRRNGRIKFEQAVKKRRVINYLVGILPCYLNHRKPPCKGQHCFALFAI